MIHAERLALVERTDDALPLRTQADLLGLSRARFYDQSVPPSPEEVAISTALMPSLRLNRSLAHAK